MDNILKLEISQKLNNLKAEYLKDRKFNQNDLQEDLDELNNLVHLEVLNNMFQLKPPTGMLKSEKEVEDYIDSSFSKDEIKAITYEKVEDIFSGWLKSIGVE